ASLPPSLGAAPDGCRWRPVRPHGVPPPGQCARERITASRYYFLAEGTFSTETDGCSGHPTQDSRCWPLSSRRWRPAGTPGRKTSPCPRREESGQQRESCVGCPEHPSVSVEKV